VQHVIHALFFAEEIPEQHGRDINADNKINDHNEIHISASIKNHMLQRTRNSSFELKIIIKMPVRVITIHGSHVVLRNRP